MEFSVWASIHAHARAGVQHRLMGAGSAPNSGLRRNRSGRLVAVAEIKPAAGGGGFTRHHSAFRRYQPAARQSAGVHIPSLWVSTRDDPKFGAATPEVTCQPRKFISTDGPAAGV